jgi:ABC-type transport system involved in cytochrome c biogenesis permease subunit
MAVDKIILFAAILLVISIIGGIPAYVIGSRRSVSTPEVAFIPFVGSTIVLLRSMEMSGWVVLVSFIPLINIVFWIWLIFAMPNRHDRTRLWGVVFLIPLVNIVAMWMYAFTLERSERFSDRGLRGYHIAPQVARRR